MTGTRGRSRRSQVFRCGAVGPWRKILWALLLPYWFQDPSVVHAHDWYPAWCCNDKDCRALSDEKGETVSEAPDGWHLWDGRIARRGHVKPSPDTKFHLCEEATTRAIICFFVPQESS
jgi:hypothetical protein